MKNLPRHLLGITAAIAFLIGCTALAFLPGRYDSAAIVLAMTARALGLLALPLVLIGGLWLASEYRHRGATRYRYSVAALIVGSILCLLASFLIMTLSIISGAALFLLWLAVVGVLAPSVRRLRGAAPGTVSAIPLYLILVPIAVFVIQMAISDPLSSFSRSRAIRNSAPLIAAIETYRATYGRYPESLLAVWPDIWPGIIGIGRFWYEPSGDSYNVTFENPTFRLGTREFVVYNPRDDQSIISHALDRLEMTPERMAIERLRGHNEVHAAREPHWKYFWFD